MKNLPIGIESIITRLWNDPPPRERKTAERPAPANPPYGDDSDSSDSNSASTSAQDS